MFICFVVEAKKTKCVSLFCTRKMVPQGPQTWPPTESRAHLSGHLKGAIICTSKPKVGVLCNTLFFHFSVPSTMKLKVNLKGFLFDFFVEAKQQKFGFSLLLHVKWAPRGFQHGHQPKHARTFHAILRGS